MNENQIKGLLTCKPENTPHAGEVRKYVVEQRVSKTGKDWTKISRSEDGSPYTVISVAKTRFESDLGHVSFNLVIEPAPGATGVVKQFTDSLRNAPPTSLEAPPGHFNELPQQYTPYTPRDEIRGKGEHSRTVTSKDDYWTIKDQRDREREARMVAQQPRIERQHSQAMALQLAAIFPRLVCDGDPAEGIIPEFNFGKLHSLITQFQRDIGYVPKGNDEPF